MVVIRGWARNYRELLNEYELPVWEDVKVLGMDVSHACTIMWIHLVPVNCTLENS